MMNDKKLKSIRLLTTFPPDGRRRRSCTIIVTDYDKIHKNVGKEYPFSLKISAHFWAKSIERNLDFYR